MNRLFSFIVGISLLLGFSSHSEMIDPRDLIMTEAPSVLNGEYAGNEMFDYMVDGEVVFSVLDIYVEKVNGLIMSATIAGTLLLHVDQDVMYFLDEETIEQNLLLWDEEESA